MDPVSLLAASGLRARMESLDLLANNLANAGTTGFKSDREFYSLFVGSGSGLAASDPLAAKSPVIERQWTDFSQGVFHTTGNPCDLALSGKGFFAVKGPAGPLYTRGGSFRASSEGNLVTAEGYPLTDPFNKPVRVDPRAPLEVTSDGSILQNGQSQGQLAIVDFKDVSGLVKQGNTYFKTNDEKLKPTPARDAQVHQGKVEGSNVGTAESAMRLVSVMRQFEMLQKAIGISSEMNRRAIEEVARVG